MRASEPNSAGLRPSFKCRYLKVSGVTFSLRNSEETIMSQSSLRSECFLNTLPCSSSEDMSYMPPMLLKSLPRSFAGGLRPAKFSVLSMSSRQIPPPMFSHADGFFMILSPQIKGFFEPLP